MDKGHDQDQPIEGEKSFHIKGQQMYDGLVVQKGFVEPDIIARLSQTRMDESDVLIAAYPRSGKDLEALENGYV